MFTYMGRTEVWCRRQRSQVWLKALVSCRQVGGECKISSESSLRRCRTSDGLICSGRGECDCGICICQVTDPGTFYGPRCECHDWVCPTYDGKTCGGKSCLRLSQNTIPTKCFSYQLLENRFQYRVSCLKKKKRLCRRVQDTHPACEGLWCSIQYCVISFKVSFEFHSASIQTNTGSFKGACLGAMLFCSNPLFFPKIFQTLLQRIILTDTSFTVPNVISVVSTGWWVCAKFVVSTQKSIRKDSWITWHPNPRLTAPWPADGFEISYTSYIIRAHRGHNRDPFSDRPLFKLPWCWKYYPHSFTPLTSILFFK